MPLPCSPKTKQVIKTGNTKIGFMGPGRPRSRGFGFRASQTFKSKHLCKLFPPLYRCTRGGVFRLPVVRTWLRCYFAGSSLRVPSASELGRLFRYLKRRKSFRAWVPSPIKYRDPCCYGTVDNVDGFTQRVEATGKAVAWHESGNMYQLESEGENAFKILKTATTRPVGCAIQKKDLTVVVGGKSSVFRRTLIFSPRNGDLSPAKPDWSLIYLHSFGDKGTEYVDSPHYFHMCGANIRVVIPTAPLLEQDCFSGWNVWKGERLGWRQKQFNSWFNYLTNHGGSAENELDLTSLVDMRNKLHRLIDNEVQMMGGDPKRVIIGGKSQGCCVALDVAMSYPKELAGAIGIVGHLLSSTTLDESKRRLPLYLFQEESDEEMNWHWVEGTVQRLLDRGFSATVRRESDPEGGGHWVQEIEGKWIRNALRHIILGRSGARESI